MCLLLFHLCLHFIKIKTKHKFQSEKKKKHFYSISFSFTFLHLQFSFPSLFQCSLFHCALFTVQCNTFASQQTTVHTTAIQFLQPSPTFIHHFSAPNIHLSSTTFQLPKPEIFTTPSTLTVHSTLLPCHSNTLLHNTVLPFFCCFQVKLRWFICTIRFPFFC